MNIRFYILVFSSILAGVVYFWAGNNTTLLVQTYALLSVTFLYFTLLASPVARIFIFLPYRGLYLKARRALGVSAFLFALLHSYFAFFNVIGGFEGLQFLSGNYLLGVIIGTINLIILSLMAATASEVMVAKLTYPKWKLLHRFVYLVAILVVVHATIMGSHFADLSGIIPRVFYTLAAILLVLEVIRLYRFLKSRG